MSDTVVKVIPADPPVRLGVGLDTSRSGHDAAFLTDDLQPATAELVWVQGSMPGHGNDFPSSIFANHVVAAITNAQGTTTLSDPSYGKTYANSTELDNSAIGYYGVLTLKTLQEQDLDKQIRAGGRSPAPGIRCCQSVCRG
jgi:hypothetical protein